MSTTSEAIRLFRRGKNQEAWGFVLLGISGALWLWFAFLLLTPYGSCESRLFTDAPTANAGTSFRNACAAERDWPELLGVLGLSVPTSVVGAVLHTSGRFGILLSEQVAATAAVRRRPETAGDDAS
ncbi:hypothetical protein [Streptomyces sp. NPDC050428]|uniref:hypothetical protein n=1 Tax=Streptomyces sp. NPDC050428 TaxID=3155757 RepID=UPI003446611E